MSYLKILTAQDLSCLGQCSLTAALPILSACGHEVCVLPSELLSTHTVGFGAPYCRDFAECMRGVLEHWLSLGVKFDGVLIGYLGKKEHADILCEALPKLLREGAPIILDPCLADEGTLYPEADEGTIEGVEELADMAQYILPNLFEARILIGDAPSAKTSGLPAKLARRFPNASIVLKGVREGDQIGELAFSAGESMGFFSEYRPRVCHGAGDVFAAAFAGKLLKGKDFLRSAAEAHAFVNACIDRTIRLEKDVPHGYGLAFEPMLGMLCEKK